MPAAVRTSNSVGRDNGTTPWNPSLAMTSVAGDLWIVAGFAAVDGNLPTANWIRWNGVDLTQRVAVSQANSKSELWDLASPDIGSYNLTANVTGAGNMLAAIGASFLTGAGARGNTASAVGTSTTPSQVVVGVVSGIVLDCMGHDAYGTTQTPGAGQTKIWEQFGAGALLGAGSWEAGAASVTMSWTNDVSQPWALTLISYLPVPTGNQVHWFFSKMRDFYRDLKAGLIPPDGLRRRYGDLVTI